MTHAEYIPSMVLQRRFPCCAGSKLPQARQAGQPTTDPSRCAPTCIVIVSQHKHMHGYLTYMPQLLTNEHSTAVHFLSSQPCWPQLCRSEPTHTNSVQYMLVRVVVLSDERHAEVICK